MSLMEEAHEKRRNIIDYLIENSNVSLTFIGHGIFTIDTPMGKAKIIISVPWNWDKSLENHYQEIADYKDWTNGKKEMRY